MQYAAVECCCNGPWDIYFNLFYFVFSYFRFNYLISRLEQSPSRSSAVIQPGLFKGTYGVHGIEIIQLKYDENGKGVQGIKITVFNIKLLLN